MNYCNVVLNSTSFKHIYVQKAEQAIETLFELYEVGKIPKQRLSDPGL